MAKPPHLPRPQDGFDSIESVVDAIRDGQMVVVTDDADRENEGDLVMAAEKVTAEAINFMAQHGRGLICVPTTSARLHELGITRNVGAICIERAQGAQVLRV